MNRATFGKQAEDLDWLAQLAEVLKDPKAIVKAQEEYRKQLALSDEEEARAKKARGLFEENEKLSVELDKKRVTLENISKKNEADLADLVLQRKSLADSLALIKSQAEANERVALKNDEASKKLEAELVRVNKLKSDYEEKNQRLNDRESALDLRAEKILLREKASEL